MTSEDFLAPYLAPISKEDPSGPSLKYEPEYDAIREAIRSEESHLPQGVWQRKVKQSDWKKAQKLCEESLTKKSKDLQIAAWLIEALIHTGEVEDVRNGFDIFHDITVTFWDTLHPLIPEDGDIEFRLAPFFWLNEKLSNSLKFIKITQKTQVGASIYTFNNWIELTRNRDLYQVEDRSPEPDVLDQIGSNKNPTILDLENNISKTPTEFYQHFFDQIQHMIDTCVRIETFLDKKLSEDAITLFKVKKVLQDIQGVAREILHKRGALEDEEGEETNEGNAHEEETEAETLPENGVLSPEAPEKLTFTEVKGVPIQKTKRKVKKQTTPEEPLESLDMSQINSRDQAYELIQNAATYLEEIEPHSPVPFMIKKAVSLRNKNFMELMNEIQSNSGGVNALWGNITSPSED